MGLATFAVVAIIVFLLTSYAMPLVTQSKFYEEYVIKALNLINLPPVYCYRFPVTNINTCQLGHVSNLRATINERLQNTKESLYVITEGIDDPDLLNGLCQVSQKGVNVLLVVRSSTTSQLQILKQLVNCGVRARIYNTNINELIFDESCVLLSSAPLIANELDVKSSGIFTCCDNVVNSTVNQFKNIWDYASQVVIGGG